MASDGCTVESYHHGRLGACGDGDESTQTVKVLGLAAVVAVVAAVDWNCVWRGKGG